MSTYIPSVAETVLGMIGLIACACLLAHLKKDAPPARNEELIRRHRRIQEHQLGRPHRNDGFTVLQVMWCISAILGAHVLLVVLHFIAFAVFGMDQPRW